MLRQYPVCAIALCCVACAAPQDPPEWINNSTYPTGMAEDIWLATETEVGEHIGLTNYTVIMDGHFTPGDTAEADVVRLVVATPFPPASEVHLTQEVTDRSIAGVLCHELGHVYFLETTGDPDSNHEHTEWGYTFNTPGTTCYAVAESFMAYHTTGGAQ